MERETREKVLGRRNFLTWDDVALVTFWLRDDARCTLGRMKRVCVLALLALLPACPTNDPVDGTSGGDAGSTQLPDASVTTDAAVPMGDAGTPPDAAVTTDAGPPDAGSPDAAVAMCGSAPCKRAGESCVNDDECLGECIAALLGDISHKVCAEACLSQGQCDGVGLRLYCAPDAVGSSTGKCVPRSPAHCAACVLDSDCGVMNEVCVQLTDGRAKSCLVDCSISGAAACPDDYACTQVPVGNGMRSLCRPVGDCLDSQGGFCDRYTASEPCERGGVDGTCTGTRTCQPSGRFSSCNASEPECLATCASMPATGCTVDPCASAITQVTSCGSCSNNCAAQTNTTTTNAFCSATDPHCQYSCKGEHYDVDLDFSDGCEVSDTGAANHTQVTATQAGVFDSCVNADATFTFAGVLVSDDTLHENPVVPSFDVVMGYAPDWFKVQGNGNCPGLTCVCSNDISVTLTMANTVAPDCYRLFFHNFTCDTDATGTCTITSGVSSYTSGEVLYGHVDKICSSAELVERATYTVSGHL